MSAASSLPSQPPLLEQQCPNCQASLPITPGYVTWCEHCNWNLLSHSAAQPRSIFQHFYLSLGERFSRTTFEEMVETASLQSRRTFATSVALVAAILIHCATLSCLVLAFVLLRAWPNFFAIVGALLCAGIAWLLRPRIFQPVEGQIARTQYPTLYHVVDQIASHLGAPPIHSIIITEQFNAAFGKTGWRQRNTLFLGLPLFTILAPQERVALIAHELAHSINGDVSRGTLVGTAIDTLQGWRGLLQAHPSAAGGDKLLAAALNPVIALMLVAAWSAKMGALVLAHLLWHDSQRAEYLADALAATVSSTPAMLSCLEKLHFAALFDQAVQTTALNAQARNVFDELALLIAALPARELLRIQRLQQLQSSRLDTTHPPTAYRIARLKSHPIPIAKYSCTDEESARMDQEFHPLRARVQRALVDGYRQQLYY